MLENKIVSCPMIIKCTINPSRNVNTLMKTKFKFFSDIIFLNNLKYRCKIFIPQIFLPGNLKIFKAVQTILMKSYYLSQDSRILTFSVFFFLFLCFYFCCWWLTVTIQNDWKHNKNTEYWIYFFYRLHYFHDVDIILYNANIPFIEVEMCQPYFSLRYFAHICITHLETQ